MVGEGTLTEEAGLRRKQRHPEPTGESVPGKAPTQATSEAAPFLTLPTLFPKPLPGDKTALSPELYIPQPTKSSHGAQPPWPCSSIFRPTLKWPRL